MKGNQNAKGRIVSEEERRKISYARSGKSLSDSHRAAIGAGLKRYWDAFYATNPRDANAFLDTELTKWARKVKVRDGYICQHCGCDDEIMHAHHIKPKSKFPELAFDIENGICLCWECHKLVHYGDS